MEYSYREINLNDYENIIELWRETPGVGLSSADGKENLELFIERNKGFSYICEFRDKIVGTILCGHDGRRGYIYHLCVHGGHRRKGIVEKLVNLSLEGLKSCGDCGELPCKMFVALKDPNISQKEHLEEFKNRVNRLKN
ncbi:MAG: GNAT family N-acetyltransferase [Halanaerobiaceae bacterium]|jgi:ribosomal protein S18 acetylase RimI-like enzyme|nr:GNAT family N-acetyltransferase [Halanaerobiaceae bacterium]